MIALRDQAYHVPGLPKDLRIIYPQGICTPEVYKGNLIAHCHDDNDSYADLNFKEDNPSWQKEKHMEKVYIKYYLKNNPPNHEAIPHKQIEK